MDSKQHKRLLTLMSTFIFVRMAGVAVIWAATFFAVSAVKTPTEAASIGMMGAYVIIAAYVFGYFLSKTQKNQDIIYECAVIKIAENIMDGKTLVNIYDESRMRRGFELLLLGIISLLVLAMVITTGLLTPVAVPIAMYLFGRLQVDLYHDTMHEALNDVANHALQEEDDEDEEEEEGEYNNEEN